MPTLPPSPHRPFLSTFLSAFRARSAYAKPASTPSSTSTPTAFASLTAQSSATASARSITTTPFPSQPTTSSLQPTSTSSPIPLAKPASTSTSIPTSPTTSTITPKPSIHSPRNFTSASPPQAFRARHPPQRRGSDSSSDGGGFREVLGGEKWYVGGRTGSGEERFYRLGMVRKERSWEEGSVDRLSL